MEIAELDKVIEDHSHREKVVQRSTRVSNGDCKSSGDDERNGQRRDRRDMERNRGEQSNQDRDRDRSRKLDGREGAEKSSRSRRHDEEAEAERERSRRRESHSRRREIDGEEERMERELMRSSHTGSQRRERDTEAEMERTRIRDRVSKRLDGDEEAERERSSSRSRRHDKEADLVRESSSSRSKRYDKEAELARERSSSRSRRHDRETERERSSSRSRRHDREAERERSGSRSRRHDREAERERSGSRSMRHDKEVEAERERSSSRSRRRGVEEEEEIERLRSSHNGSQRHERDAEAEMDRARTRDRVLREREADWEMRERDGSRRSKEKKESAEPEADPERDQRTVFAYQMPLKAVERDVYEFFSQAGKVRDVRLIMDRNSRRSKGVGYIEFYDVASVQSAILLSGQPLLGQPVMVKHSEAEKNLVPSSTSGGAGLPGSERKLYVGNLHFNMTEEHLRQIFEAFGPVELVQMPLDMETGHCKGFGFVQFAQLEHAKVAQQSLNGILEIAGRIIKVSSVIEHIGGQDTTSSAADFDDEDGGVMSLNARSRALLMQKLDRTGTASSIAESLGVPVFTGTIPTSLVPSTKVIPTLSTSSLETIGEPSEFILLKNMFDPKTESDPDFDLDIKEDVRDECSKFGVLERIYVDKNSNGFVYLRFNSIAAAVNCQRAMHMRWFARRCISATFLRRQEYELKVRST